jgi:predicted nuclease with TOPRIM domain
MPIGLRRVALLEAQRAIGDQLQHVQEQIESLQSEVATRFDQLTGIEQEVKALRDEVKGLYVESSTLKQQMDELKDDVGAFDSRLAAFRMVAGIFMAAMAIALFIIFMLAARR